MIRWIVVLAAAAGCSFRADYGGGEYTCPDGQTCPDGYRCVDFACVADDAGQVSTDAAPTPDAPPDPDAAPVDLCEAAMGAPPSDTCAAGDANDLTAAARMPGGVTVYGDTRPQGNDLATPAQGCLPSATPGTDAFYTLRPSVGETITARLTAADDFDSVLYLLDGCMTGATCLDGDDELFTTPGSQTDEEIAHEVTAADTFYLVVDSIRLDTALYSEGCYALRVTLQ